MNQGKRKTEDKTTKQHASLWVRQKMERDKAFKGQTSVNRILAKLYLLKQKWKLEVSIKICLFLLYFCLF